MKRWKRLAPSHADPWRGWLTYRGSLTWRIVSRAEGFRVERIQQRLRHPNEDEYRALGRPTHKRALVREVILHAGGRPVVLAHSIAARRDLFGVWRSLRGLGTRPLAEALFTDPLVRREPLEFVRIDFRHPLWKRACKVLGRELPSLWARRSLFRKRGRPLMVTEVFLPEILELGA
ncbi:chorismate--pyruvate lyase family protein [Usitatibacter palustris]|uniref:Probable chorismate pyruvate-lyase n=1 Tax=Usitatibacter palustris TaxID=2732487 RepID=A0A6M4H497_9PROT|nr:chorismate lyase [Usitatibacter palustris]QJR13314.1 Chorismate pyruvate-lyase [Usitatibacter palustris]